MVLRLNTLPQIENLRNYPAELVEQLRQLLASGAPAQPDPRRKDFYELESDSRIFYIHISPVNGKVLLLATWLKQKEPAAVAPSPQAA
jgi:hypothetical protein